ARRAALAPSGIRRASPTMWKSPPADGSTARWLWSRCVLARMRDGVDDDVRKVVVNQSIEHFATGTLPGHNARRLEDLQMLADQRLWHAERVDQFVHAAVGLAQLQHNGDTHGCGQRAKQLAGGVENLSRRRDGGVGERGVSTGPGCAMLVFCHAQVRTPIAAGRGRRCGGHHHRSVITSKSAGYRGWERWGPRSADFH